MKRVIINGALLHDKGVSLSIERTSKVEYVKVLSESGLLHGTLKVSEDSGKKTVNTINNAGVLGILDITWLYE